MRKITDPIKPATISQSFWDSLCHPDKVTVAEHERIHAECEAAVANAKRRATWNEAADKVVDDLIGGYKVEEFGIPDFAEPLVGTDLSAQLSATFAGGIEMTIEEVLAGPIDPNKGYRATGYGNIAVFDLGAFADIETHYVIEFVAPGMDHFHTLIATLPEWMDHFGSRPNQDYEAHVVGYRTAEEVAHLTDLQRGLILGVYDPSMEHLTTLKPEWMGEATWAKLNHEEQLQIYYLAEERDKLRSALGDISATIDNL